MPDDFAPPLRMPVSLEACEWIVDRALAGASEIDILTGLCERLEAAGFGILRASVANDLLDPTYDARGVRWNRGKGGLEEVFPRTEGFVVNESWTRSPFFALAESGRPRLRRRLNATYRRGEFPLLDEFERMGGTDYIAFATPVGDTVLFGDGQGIVSSWLTDAQGGFSDEKIEAIAYLLPTLALAFKLQNTHRSARTAVAT
jgi:adenylate cyclase